MLFAVLAVGCLQPALAEHVPGKVVLVVADRLTLEDLQSADLPNINALIRNGSLGLVAAYSAGRKTPESVIASVGAGAPARGLFALHDAYSAEEIVPAERATAAEVYARRTGRHAAEGSITLISIGSVTRANRDAGFTGQLGSLGEALRESGKQAAFFGNSDVGDSNRRSMIAIVMDKHGYVPLGDVSSEMLIAGRSPSGLVTDVDKMASAVTDALPQAAFVLLDFGDSARVDFSESALSPEAFTNYRQAALENLDRLVSRLIPMAESGDFTLIVASLVPPGGRDWHRLTPIIAFGRDLPQGLLTSATTRTPGLVAGIDIAPFILGVVGISAPTTMSGRTIVTAQDSDPLAALERLANVTARNHRVQAPLYGPIAALGILALTAGAAFAAFGARPSRTTFASIRVALIFALCVPLAALLLSSIGPIAPLPYAAAILAGATALTIIVFGAVFVLRDRCRNLPDRGALPMVFLSVLIAIAALVDAFGGGLLARFSSLASFGFRFYGIGNEYMGLAVGCLCVSMIWLVSPSPSARAKRICAGILILAAAAIGFPGFGANAGGAVTAVVTFGLLYLAISRGEFRLRHIVGTLGLAAVILLLLGAADLVAYGSDASHIGETIAATQRDGLGYLIGAVSHKLTLNARQLGTQQGKLALMGGMPLLVLWFMGIHPRLVEKTRKGRVGGRSRLLAVVAGALVALICNDNGIIVACLLLSPLVAALVLSMMEDNFGQDNGS